MTRIAFLADIHANYQAMKVATDLVERWDPDQVYVLGDFINRGPRPRACLDLLRHKHRTQNWQVILGNHEEYVLRFEREDVPRQGPHFEILRFVHWTYQTLNREEIAWIKGLPDQLAYQLPQGLRLKVTHASMAGNRVGIYPHTPRERLPELIDPKVDLFCVGHTHRPLILNVGDTRVVNAGSAGLPFDGDPRPCFVKVHPSAEAVETEIHRFEYDRDEALQDFHDTGFLEEGGAMVPIIYQELITARPLISQWRRQYHEAVLHGEISLAESVNKFLEDGGN